MEHSVDDNGVGLHGVEYREGKSRNQNPPKRSKLRWAGLRVSRDQRNRRIYAADEVKARANSAALIPQSRLRHVMLRPGTDDECVTYLILLRRRSRTSDQDEPSEGF